MKKWLSISLSVIGWLLVVLAVSVIIFGIAYGVDETDALYDRQDAYYDLEPQREAYNEVLDSMYAYMDSLTVTDSLAAEVCQTQIDSIVNSTEYDELFGVTPPPLGFSLAGMVSVMLFIIAQVPLIIGIILIVVAHKKRKKNRVEI